ncbi:hypothetical protein CYMTET_16603 [Cymbomonas tetramitiformis]|uniref:Uncharacterized protein n=1 Tax=Cymbomonas tetramitiformis TaxID=36881 RepID=A0AAE0GBU7_9CHLO|nr:hypothetical protein CYMTET_16603 [Cymbomonas tetramitiformis]
MAGLLEKLREVASTLSVAPDVARLPCSDRGVSLTFLRKCLRSCGEQASPGQVVHGAHTQGPPDDWKLFDARADPLCIRALTLGTGRSLVETMVLAAQLTGDSSFLQNDTGDMFFGPAGTFVSYGWHGTCLSELCSALELLSEQDSEDRPAQAVSERPAQATHFWWIDIFAVAQNQTEEAHKRNCREDVAAFEAVITATQRTALYWSPWSTPVPLTRVWCLFEMFKTIQIGHDLVLALSSKDKAELRLEARKGGQALRLLIDGLNSIDAAATFTEDWIRIHTEIEEELNPETEGKKARRCPDGTMFRGTCLVGKAIICFISVQGLSWCDGTSTGHNVLNRALRDSLRHTLTRTCGVGIPPTAVHSAALPHPGDPYDPGLNKSTLSAYKDPLLGTAGASRVVIQLNSSEPVRIFDTRTSAYLHVLAKSDEDRQAAEARAHKSKGGAVVRTTPLRVRDMVTTFSSNDTSVVLGHVSGAISLWCPQTGRRRRVFKPAYKGRVAALELLSDTVILSAHVDEMSSRRDVFVAKARLTLWHVDGTRQSKQAYTEELEESHALKMLVYQHQPVPIHLAAAERLARVAVAGVSGIVSVYLWNAAAGCLEELAKVTNQGGVKVTALVADNCSDRLIWGDLYGRVSVWDLAGERLERTVATHSIEVTQIQVHRSCAVTASRDGRVYVFELATFTKRCVLMHESPVLSLAVVEQLGAAPPLIFTAQKTAPPGEGSHVHFWTSAFDDADESGMAAELRGQGSALIADECQAPSDAEAPSSCALLAPQETEGCTPSASEVGTDDVVPQNSEGGGGDESDEEEILFSCQGESGGEVVIPCELMPVFSNLSGGARREEAASEEESSGCWCSFADLSAEAAREMAHALRRLRGLDRRRDFLQVSQSVSSDLPAFLRAVAPAGALCQLFALCGKHRVHPESRPGIRSAKELVCPYFDALVEALTAEDSSEALVGDFERAFEVVEVLPRVIHVRTFSRLVLASAFLRFQEHYEGGPQFRGNAFTLQDIKSWHTESSSRSSGSDATHETPVEEGALAVCRGWTYYLDWPGFNLPSPALDRCQWGMKPLRPQEQALLDAVKRVVTEKSAGWSESSYYVIGTCMEDEDARQAATEPRSGDNADPSVNFTLYPEMAHGLYFTSAEYCRLTDLDLEDLPVAVHEAMRAQLRWLGYCDDDGIIQDEKQACKSRYLPVCACIVDICQ